MATATADRIEVTRDERDNRASFGDFLRSVAIASDPKLGPEAREDAETQLRGPYGQDGEKRALLAGRGTAGGFTVPGPTIALLNPLINEASIVRPRAVMVPSDGALEIDVPMLDPTVATPTGGISAFGGLVPQWAEETHSSDTPDPRLKLAKLYCHPLKIHFSVPRSLLQANPQMADRMLLPSFAAAIAATEDKEFLTGLGGLRPIGAIHSPATITTAARGDAAAITFANARAVRARLLPSSARRAIWLCGQDGIDTLEGMTSDANSVFARATTHIDPETGEERVYLLRRPVEVTEHLPALNTAGDFGLFDFSKYLVSDPELIEVATSEESPEAFRGNQVAFRVMRYVGGMPWLPGPVDMSGSTDSASAFVLLGPQ